MSEVKGRHWPPGTPFVGGKPGDFIFSDEYIDPYDSPPKWLRYQCPRGNGECSVPLAPQTTSKGHTWHWDGNREAPTLTPSINCLAEDLQTHEKYAGCGWHGFLQQGVFKSA